MGGSESKQEINQEEELKIIEHFAKHYNKAPSADEKNSLLNLLHTKLDDREKFKETIEIFLKHQVDHKDRSTKYENLAIILKVVIDRTESIENQVLALNLIADLCIHYKVWQEIMIIKLDYKDYKGNTHLGSLDSFIVKNMEDYVDIIEKQFVSSKRSRYEDEDDNEEERARQLFLTSTKSLKFAFSFMTIYNNRSLQEEGKMKYL